MHALNLLGIGPGQQRAEERAEKSGSRPAALHVSVENQAMSAVHRMAGRKRIAVIRSPLHDASNVDNRRALNIG